MPRLHDIEEIYGVRVVIVTFAEWVSHQFERAARDGLLLERELAGGWLRAYAESIAQRRRELAPIDEPCYEWLRELHAIFTATIDTLLQ